MPSAPPPAASTHVDSNADAGTGHGGADTPTPVSEPVHVVTPSGSTETIVNTPTNPAGAWDGPPDAGVANTTASTQTQSVSEIAEVITVPSTAASDNVAAPSATTSSADTAAAPSVTTSSADTAAAPSVTTSSADAIVASSAASNVAVDSNAESGTGYGGADTPTPVSQPSAPSVDLVVPSTDIASSADNSTSSGGGSADIPTPVSEPVHIDTPADTSNEEPAGEWGGPPD
jgi:hypothetical protein